MRAVLKCLICSIATGDVVARVVVRRDGALGFLPLESDSLAPCHVVVAPLRHVTDLLGATEADLVAAMLLTKDLARAMHDALGAGGVNILSASGPDSEQSVNHLHFHIVPRWQDDAFTTWPSQRSAHAAGNDAVERLVACVSPKG